MLSDIVQLTDHELDQLRDALSQGTIEPGTSLQQIRKEPENFLTFLRVFSL